MGREGGERGVSIAWWYGGKESSLNTHAGGATVRNSKTRMHAMVYRENCDDGDVDGGGNGGGRNGGDGGGSGGKSSGSSGADDDDVHIP